MPVLRAIAKLAAFATSDEHSPLLGADNTGVLARDGRPPRRNDEGRRSPFRAQAGSFRIVSSHLARFRNRNCGVIATSPPENDHTMASSFLPSCQKLR